MSRRTSRSLRALPATLWLLLGITPRFACADDLGPVRVLTPSVQRYERVIISSVPDKPPENPFDPGAAAVDAEIPLPSGKALTIPGFWGDIAARIIRRGRQW